jgi:glutamine phosphoribosylpyrophosphate amidotransferase
MTNDDIIRMAREAGLQEIYSACDEPNVRYAYENFDDEIERFANLITKHILAKSYPELVSLAAKHAAETVAAAEREACAKVCDGSANEAPNSWQFRMGANHCAEAIRKRGQG